MEVSPKAFKAINDVNIDTISQLSEKELRPLLPCLVRMALCLSVDTSQEWIHQRQLILRVLSETEIANSIVSLLSVDFHALETEVKKEQQIRPKLGPYSAESGLIASLVDGLALEFERSDGIRKFRLVLSELYSVQSYVRSASHLQQVSGVRASELFDNDVYLDDVADVLCIAVAELTSTLPLVDICETLLYVKNGPKLICRLVANCSETFHEVCLALLSNGDKQDEENFIGRIRMETIRSLCILNPYYSLVIRSEAVEMCRMPGLCILLTLDHFKENYATSEAVRLGQINDLVSFVGGLLLGSDDKVRMWFAQYMRTGQKKIEAGCISTLTLLRSELLKCLQYVLLSIPSSDDSSYNSHIIQGSALMRLYCALKGAAAMKFSEEEGITLLNLITQRTPATAAGIRFASIGLCMLLACPSLIASQEAEKKTVEWIQWLVKEESLFGQVSGVRSSFGEMLLLIAIHFHSNQLNAIVELVCSTLGMKLAIRSNSMSRMKIIFTQDVFTEQTITAHAVKVPVILNLNNNIPGFLPVHCIYQLLKNRAFTKYKVPIKEWIFKQLCNSVPPMNPVLPPLLEAFVNSIIMPLSKSGAAATNEPISEEEIFSVFKHKIYCKEDTDSDNMEVDEASPACILTTQLLLLYYILLYEDVRLAQMKVIVANDRKVLRYSEDLISSIPVFYLMQEARKEEQKFGVLFPPLLRLISTHYPHFCLVQDWLKAEKRAQIKPLSGPYSSKKEIQRLIQAFDCIEKSPELLVKVFDRLLTLPGNRLWPLCTTLVSRLPSLLPDSVPRQVLEKAKKLWWRLNSIFPDCLTVMTVNILSPPTFGARKLNWKDIVLDPLTVLRCDSRVFRCPEMMEILLHMLSAFLTASRIHFSRHMSEKPSKTVEEEKDREELRIALIAAQESAAIQILLECCLPNEADSPKKLKEVQSLVCVHLHQVFIADPNLAKLVHFQGYPSQLLSLTVPCIPSMHICVDFIPELLSQPDLSKQIFAVELCSYLCQQYSITKSLSVAKLCFNVSYTLLSILSSEKRAKYFIATLPALVRMSKPFPPLREDAENILMQLSQITLSRLAATNPTYLSSQALRQKYEDIDEATTELERIVASLAEKDPLSRSIKKSHQMLMECSSPRDKGKDNCLQL